MNKMKKIIWSVVIGVVVLIVVAVVVVGLFLGNIVKAGINRFGPGITQTSVTVEAVDLSLLNGSASIKGLVVGNPPGYQTPQAISVGKTAVAVNPMSLFSDKIVVRSIHVESPEITFEGNPFSGSNLTKIRDNVNGADKSQVQNATTNQPAATAKPGKKIEVDDFLITGAKVHVNLTGVGMGSKEMTMPLPDIHLTDLGKGTDGITATDLTRQVLDAITTATLKEVASSASNVGKGAEKLGTEGANKITKGIGNLLGK
ncbi:MAG: AsmA family protein [Verrucomicrobiota bacterium]|jgi:hypothetical protein